MIFRHPQFLFFLILLPALALAWWLRRGRVSGVTLAFRLSTAALIVLALADPLVGRPTPAQGPLVLLLDQSDSLGDAGVIGDIGMEEDRLRICGFQIGGNALKIPAIAVDRQHLRAQ